MGVYPKMDITSSVDRIAIEVAEEEGEIFREMLPQSLAEASKQDEDCVAPFKQEEIVLGPKLGSGEFSHVYEVHSFQLQQGSTEGLNLSDRESEKRLHMKNVEQYHNTGKARYALKHIKQTYLQDNGEEDYVQTAGDLALEAEFLAHLNHPNIIKLRGITHSGAAGFAHGPCGFFLVIDRLFETLDQRIKTWHVHASEHTISSSKHEPSKSRRMFSKVVSKGLKVLPSGLKVRPARGSSGEGIEVELKGNLILDECLDISLQISAAMTYLHKHSIIFRDLKPENIGFDVRGDVKIFDLGLARFVPQEGNQYLDKYEMSGAGSPRYMSPECLAGEDYNLKSDVYTFAIVMWEMLTGKVPYSFIKSRDELLQYVLKEEGRPAIDNSWPVLIKGMLINSFDADHENRPTMVSLHNTIRTVLVSLRGGDCTGLSDAHINRRRSIASLRNMNSDKKRSSLFASIRNFKTASDKNVKVEDTLARSSRSTRSFRRFH